MRFLTVRFRNFSGWKIGSNAISPPVWGRCRPHEKTTDALLLNTWRTIVLIATKDVTETATYTRQAAIVNIGCPRGGRLVKRAQGGHDAWLEYSRLVLRKCIGLIEPVCECTYGTELRRRRVHQLCPSRQRRARSKGAKGLGREPASRARNPRRAAARQDAAHLVGSQAPGQRLLRRHAGRAAAARRGPRRRRLAPLRPVRVGAQGAREFCKAAEAGRRPRRRQVAHLQGAEDARADREPASARAAGAPRLRVLQGSIRKPARSASSTKSSAPRPSATSG